MSDLNDKYTEDFGEDTGGNSGLGDFGSGNSGSVDSGTVDSGRVDSDSGNCENKISSNENSGTVDPDTVDPGTVDPGTVDPDSGNCENKISSNENSGRVDSSDSSSSSSSSADESSSNHSSSSSAQNPFFDSDGFYHSGPNPNRRDFFTNSGSSNTNRASERNRSNSNRASEQNRTDSNRTSEQNRTNSNRTSEQNRTDSNRTSEQNRSNSNRTSEQNRSNSNRTSEQHRSNSNRTSDTSSENIWTDRRTDRSGSKHSAKDANKGMKFKMNFTKQTNNTGSDASGGSSKGARKGSGRFLAMLVTLAVILGIASSSMVITRQNEFSVIKQFGAIVRVENEPGLSFRIPFIQQVSTLDNTLLYYDIPSSDVITSDKKTMIVDSYVIWCITDAEKYIKTLSGSNSNAEARLNTIVYNAVKNTISSMSQDEVIASRDGNITVSDVEEEITTNDMEINDEDVSKPANVKIKSLTDEITSNLSDFEDYGIDIVKTEVKVLDLPDANKEAVYERMISERNNVAASYEAQGKADAQIIINTTDKEVRIMEAEAQAQAEAIVADGEAQYMQILSNAYSDSSKAEFYSFVRSLDAAKESLVNTGNILILDENSPIAKIFY